MPALVHSPAAIIRELIDNLRLGVVPSEDDTTIDDWEWPVFVSQEPDRPDNCVTVYTTEIIHQGRHHTDGSLALRRGVQVRVRATDDQQVFEKIEEIAVAFDEDVLIKRITISQNSYSIHAITRTSGPIALGKQPGTKRDIYTLNVTFSVRLLTF